MILNTIINDDALNGLKTLATHSVDCIITSPPYYQLRDYGVDGQIGLEDTLDEYISKLVRVFRECYRVLKTDGTMWIVIGDSYNGDKKGITDAKKQYLDYRGINKNRGRWKRKTLLMVPSRLAIAMIDEGWILRNEIIWHKPNVMPQSIKDRFTVDFEKVFLFTKSEKYIFNQQKEPMKEYGKHGFVNKLDHLRKYNRTVGAKKQDEVGRQDYKGFNARYEPAKDGMRNKRAVWSIPPKATKVKHFAAFPPALVDIFIDAGLNWGGVILDPFCGKGTTLERAKYKGYKYIGIELNPEYVKMAEEILEKTPNGGG